MLKLQLEELLSVRFPSGKNVKALLNNKYVLCCQRNSEREKCKYWEINFWYHVKVIDKMSKMCPSTHICTINSADHALVCWKISTGGFIKEYKVYIYIFRLNKVDFDDSQMDYILPFYVLVKVNIIRFSKRLM